MHFREGAFKATQIMKERYKLGSILPAVRFEPRTGGQEAQTIPQKPK